MSFGMIVMCLACSVDRFDCSRRPTKKVSPTSCKAIIAVDCRQRSALNPCTISFTTLWNGSLLISNSVPLWYFFIFLKALNPLFTLFASPSICLSAPSFSSFFPFFLIALLPSFYFPSSSFLILHGLEFSSLCKPCLVTKQMPFNLPIYLSSYTSITNKQPIHMVKQKWNTKGKQHLHLNSTNKAVCFDYLWLNKILSCFLVFSYICCLSHQVVFNLLQP